MGEYSSGATPFANTLEQLFKQSAGRDQRNADVASQSQGERAKSILSAQEAQQKQSEYGAKKDADAQSLMGLTGAANLKDAGDAASRRGQSIQLGDVHIGQDPTVKMQQMASGKDEQARMAATKQYQAALGKLAPQANAAMEGMKAINDPNNIGSLGQAKTLMLKTMGMNRYNEQEANAVLPPQLMQMASSLFNKVGDDNAPLAPAQKAMVGQFFQNQLEQVKAQHDVAHKNAMNTYSLSPYSDPSRAAQMDVTMFKPFDDQLDHALAPMQNQQALQKMQQPQQVASQPQQSPGLLDRAGGALKALFGHSSTPQQSQTAVAQQQPPTPQNAVPMSAPAQPRTQGSASGPHGPSVVQDGHSYNWNPQSGQYE